MSFLRKVVAPLKNSALWEANNEHIMDLVPLDFIHHYGAKW
jgi:hypothetical protein